MESKTRRVVCWKCKETFRVDVSEIVKPVVVVYRAADKSAQQQKPKQKLIVKCPNCGADNEVLV